MDRLSLFCVVLVGLVAVAGTAWAEDDDDDFDWKEELQRDLVTVENGEMTYSETELCEIEGSSRSMQVRWEAKAPEEGVLSRDQFVAMTTEINLVTLFGFLERANVSLSDYLDRVSCQPIDDAIGEVDMTLSVTYAERGLQFAVQTDEGTKRYTSTWDDVF